MATSKQKEHAWNGANIIKGENPDVWRKDKYGDTIKYSSYGTYGEYGWEVDHKNPKSNGGTDHLRNIQALHTETNREKSDNCNFKKK